MSKVASVTAVSASTCTANIPSSSGCHQRSLAPVYCGAAVLVWDEAMVVVVVAVVVVVVVAIVVVVVDVVVVGVA